jgi:hypothetical protein
VFEKQRLEKTLCIRIFGEVHTTVFEYMIVVVRTRKPCFLPWHIKTRECGIVARVITVEHVGKSLDVIFGIH